MNRPKVFWFRRETEPDPTTPKAALRYTGKVSIWKSADTKLGKTELVATVDSVAVAQKMVELANETYIDKE